MTFFKANGIVCESNYNVKLKSTAKSEDIKR